MTVQDNLTFKQYSSCCFHFAILIHLLCVVIHSGGREGSVKELHMHGVLIALYTYAQYFEQESKLYAICRGGFTDTTHV